MSTLVFSPPKSRACPCSVSPHHNQTRIKGKIKSSLRVSRAAVGNALEETRREENAYAFPAQCRLPLKLPTFRVTIALQLLQIVMVTKQLLRLYSFQSVFFSPFHYSVTDVKIHRKSAILGGGTFSSEGNVSAKVFIFR